MPSYPCNPDCPEGQNSTEWTAGFKSVDRRQGTWYCRAQGHARYNVLHCREHSTLGHRVLQGKELQSREGYMVLQGIVYCRLQGTGGYKGTAGC